MGNAKIWFYPQGASTATEIDLGRGLSDLVITHDRDRVDAVASWGVPLGVDLGEARGIRVVLQREVNAARIRQLRTLANHLNLQAILDR